MSVGPPRLKRAVRGVDEQGARRYERDYVLKAEFPPIVDHEGVVSAALGIDIGDGHPLDAGARCSSVECFLQERKGGGLQKYWEWLAKVQWSTRQSGLQSPNPDPTKRPMTVSIDEAVTEEPAWEDLAGVPITNSAEDPVPRPKKRSRRTFRYVKNYREFDHRLCRHGDEGGLVFTRNRDGFVAAGPYESVLGNDLIAQGEGRIEKISVDLARENGIDYAIARIEIATDAELFIDKFLDQGFFYLDFDQDGILRSTPFRVGSQLAQTPQPLSNGSPADFPDTLSVQHYFLADWAPLKLGENNEV